MKNLLLALILLSVVSCGTMERSDYDYQERINYDAMKCQQLCSSGTVTQIAELGCACNLQNKSSQPVSSSSNGNVNYIYVNDGNSHSRAPANTGNNMMGEMGQILNGWAKDMRSNKP